MATISGVVRDATNTTVCRLVRAYHRSSGSLVAEGYSNPSTGAYSLTVPTTGLHTVVALDINGDPFWSSSTSCMVAMTGTNGSTTFTDTKGLSLTRNGDIVVSTTNPPPIDTSSAYFDGTGDYISAASSSVFNVGTGDFTAEIYGRLSTFTGDAYRGLININHSGGDIFLRYGNSGYGYKLQCAINGGTTATTYSCAKTQSTDAGTWRHFAVMRKSGWVSISVDGARQAINSGPNPATYPYKEVYDNTSVGNGVLSLGFSFLGNAAYFRFSKVAKWTDNFTPPNSPSAYAAYASDSLNAQTFDLVTPA